MALRDDFADLLGTPANPANPAKTRAIACDPADSGGCESLRILRIDGDPTVAAGAKFAEFAAFAGGQSTDEPRRR